jgi:hypothetical protein
MATKNQASSKLSNESKASFECERIESLVAKLARFYSVMGNRPDEPGALALMAEILCQSGTDEQIAIAMSRCTRECRYPVRLPDLLQRLPGKEIPAIDAEARRSWDEVGKFVRKYVGNDPYGNWGPEYGSWKDYPKLNNRIMDTVRRVGGWRVFGLMTDKDYPFVQQRFIEEYIAWTAVEGVDASTLLTQMPQLRLGPKTAEQQARKATRPPSIAPPVFKPKPIPKVMTGAEFRDRREMLRQQAETLKARSAAKLK